jgi:hypothetical protein
VTYGPGRTKLNSANRKLAQAGLADGLDLQKVDDLFLSSLSLTCFLIRTHGSVDGTNRVSRPEVR